MYAYISFISKSPERDRENNVNYWEFPVTIRDFKESHIQFKKWTDRKRCNHNFFFKQKSETNNNTSSVNKTVTEDDKILETERGNSSPSSNSKQRKRHSNRTFE